MTPLPTRTRSVVLLRMPLVHVAGALLSMAVISGAIFFHLFTPLGLKVRNTCGSLDGGELFALACGVWFAAALVLWLRRGALVGLSVAGVLPMVNAR